jgi:hypothetical protein
MTDGPHERPSIAFIVLIAAAALYLAVRLLQGVAWLVGRLL